MPVDPKIIKTVQKLLQLADTSKNPNLEEAATAASKAQQIMEKYRISEELLESNNEITHKQLLDNGKADNWKIFLVTSIAKHNGCFIVTSPTYKTDKEINIIGTSNDIKTVQSLFKYISGELNKLSIFNALQYKQQFGDYPNKEYKESFFLGGIKTIENRLETANREIRDQQIREAQTPAKQSEIKNALARIDNRVSLAKDWLEDYLQKQNKDIKIKDVKIKSKRPDGYVAGQHAASKINIAPDRKKLK